MIVPVILIIVSVIYIACCYVFGEGLLTVNSVYSIPLLSVWGIYGSYELVRDIKETFKDTNPKDKNSEVKSKNRKTKASAVKYNKNDYEEDIVLENILNVFFAFKDKFPDKVVSLHLNQSRSIHNYIAFDVCFFLDGKIEFYKSIEAAELLNFFSLTEDDGTFQTYEYTRNTLKQPKNTDDIDQLLKSHIKHYMAQHPTRVFDLSKNGAVIRFW